MSGKEKFPSALLNACKKVKAKRPRTVIDHILKHGHITTQELKEQYGYNHPPRAARDVKESGIPLESFRVEGRDGRKIAAYRFGDINNIRTGKFKGRTALGKKLKEQLILESGAKCAIYGEHFDPHELQIDHRIPYEVAGEDGGELGDFMLLCASANRAKSWSCEHCPNWLEKKDPVLCRACYWANPETYSHVALKALRRVDIVWVGDEVIEYERLSRKAKSLQKDIPRFVKDVLKKTL